jgi:hypothetical protein
LRNSKPPETKRPRNVDPQPAPFNRENGGGEREGIGRIRKADRTAAEAAERFDPDGRKSPEGEWELRSRPKAQAGRSATGQKLRSRP